MMSTWHYYVWLLVPLTTCVISSYLYEVCLPVQYYVGLAVWCLTTCIVCIMYALLCDVCLPVWCLFNYLMSSYLYDVFLALVSSCPYNVCSTVSCLPTCLMFAKLYDVCLHMWYLLFCTVHMMSAYFYIWCQPTYMIAA
jgi:hypothetical protein